MEIAVKTLFLGLNPRIIYQKQRTDVYFHSLSCRRVCFSPQAKCMTRALWGRESHKFCPAVCAVLSGMEDLGVSASKIDDISVTVSKTNEAKELKISVEVSGGKTREIFDDVFNKMVAAAQPIPGFRRVKGGKTPNIPRDVLLEILGPSKVYKQVIKKVINSSVAEYVEKEGLKVTKDLIVAQSYEDLEDTFEPAEKFTFDAIVRLKDMN